MAGENESPRGGRNKGEASVVNLDEALDGDFFSWDILLENRYWLLVFVYNSMDMTVIGKIPIYDIISTMRK